MKNEVRDGDLTISAHDHKARCRFCWRKIGDSEVYYKIYEKTKIAFETLTQLEFAKNEKFSGKSCNLCNANLKQFSIFREELIRKQTKLSLLVLGRAKIFVVNPNDDNIAISLEDPVPSKGNDPATTDENLGEEQPEEAEFLDEESIDESQLIELEDETNFILPEETQFETEALTNEEVETCYEETYDSEVLYEVQDGNYSSDDYPKSKRRRVQAWLWTREMEIDLVRYEQRFGQGKKSDASMCEKIARKFKAKQYPPISAKSLKHKLMKLHRDKVKLKELKEEANKYAESYDEFDDCSAVTEKSRRKAKSNTSWSEPMEALLLCFIDKFRSEQPGLSLNDLIKSVTTAMNLEGHNVSTPTVRYRFKKLNLDTEKLHRLKQKAKEFEKKELSIIDENSSTVIDSYLPKVGRNLHWNDEMKIALITHRRQVSKDAKSHGKSADLWNLVAERMKADGFGNFTDPKKLMFKYFNLMRESKWKNFSPSDQ